MSEPVCSITGSKTILSNREDVSDIEAEEQLNFVFYVLQASGIKEESLEACLQDGFSVRDKIKLRELCEREQISIVLEPDGSLRIYIRVDNQNELIAEWFRPIHTLRVDPPGIYVEILFRWWSLSEEYEESNAKNIT